MVIFALKNFEKFIGHFQIEFLIFNWSCFPLQWSIDHSFPLIMDFPLWFSPIHFINQILVISFCVSMCKRIASSEQFRSKSVRTNVRLDSCAIKALHFQKTNKLYQACKQTRPALSEVLVLNWISVTEIARMIVEKAGWKPKGWLISMLIKRHWAPLYDIHRLLGLHGTESSCQTVCSNDCLHECSIQNIRFE